MLSAIVYVGCPILFLLGAMSDLLSYRIPNWIPAALLALFAIAVPFSDMSLATAGWHVLVGLGALLLGMLLFGFKIVGGGDAKLFAAIALWMGPLFIVPYSVVFGLVGGGVALLLLTLRRMPLPTITAWIPGISQLMHPKGPIPYGIALGFGALIMVSSSKYLAIWF